MNPSKKKAINKSKYKLNTNILNESRMLKYKEMDPFQKSVYHEKTSNDLKQWVQVQKTHIVKNAGKTLNVNMRRQIQQKTSRNRVIWIITITYQNFTAKIKESPYYICSVCNCLLYRKSVKL